MGQSISVTSKPVAGYCVFTTDRVLTGQDGERFSSADQAVGAEGFSADLASRLFAADDAVQNVFVASSEVIVGREVGWDSAAVDSASAIIKNLHRFYNE